MRIRTLIIAAVLPVVALVNLAYAFSIARSERRDALARVDAMLVDEGRVLAIVTADPLYDGNVEQLRGMLDAYFTDSGFVALTLTERSGDIKISRTRVLPGPGGALLAHSDSIVRNSDVLGEIRMEYSTALIEQRLIASRNRLIAVSFALLGVLAIAIYLVARMIATPLDRLTAAARATAEGMVDRPVDAAGASEMVSLATSFNRMRDAVRGQMTALAENNARLRAEVAERGRLESQLLQAQKMEAIGRLAGGIAHDFNNLLTVINGTSEMLLAEPMADASMRADLEGVLRAGESAAGLTRQLLAFSRKQVMQPRVLDLDSVLAHTEPLVRRLIGERVRIDMRLLGGDWRVRADQNQIEQVIVNLCVNARDAMPNGGTITLETRNEVLDEAYARDHVDVVAGEYVALVVSDNGQGMDEATLGRIWEPFFTTKGLGTGLGLATVYGIITQAGGHASCTSPPGEGTTFRLYLPRVKESASAEEISGETTMPAATELTILVVEDAVGVLRLARDVLARAGHRVLEAASGEEALRTLEQHEGALDLLLTDVVLPGMRGPELAERLRARRPELAVLFMSGYTADALGGRGELDPGLLLLEKPFTPRTLERKVQQALRRQRQNSNPCMPLEESGG